VTVKEFENHLEEFRLANGPMVLQPDGTNTLRVKDGNSFFEMFGYNFIFSSNGINGVLPDPNQVELI